MLLVILPIFSFFILYFFYSLNSLKMIKRECQEIGTITKCQIPIDQDWKSGITDLLALIFLLWFTCHIVIRVLGRMIR